MKRIAVVGTGIAGLVAARLLAGRHDVTVFEAADRIGGHTHTVDVRHEGVDYAIDTGFIVCNDRTYPNLLRLFDLLGVELQDTEMSFSVRCERTGLEYCGSQRSLWNGLFAQRRNLLRPSFLGMLRDILRFGRAAPALLQDPDDRRSLGELLADGGYGAAFIEHYLVPMGAAIWSAPPAELLRMPAVFFVRFFHHHGMLSVRGRPQWRVVRGGSRSYLGPLAGPLQDRIRLSAPVRSVTRPAGGGALVVTDAGTERFDQVVLAVHSDQALAMLDDADPAERAVLGGIPYQANDVVLHTDASLLPRRRRAWAAWNYHLDRGDGPATVTYHMNRLQGLRAPVEFCVTLNRTAAIDPDRILRRFTYHHPQFGAASLAAQARLPEVQGRRDIFFCGAWCGYGFHEDGVRSALAVAARFGLSLDDLAGERRALAVAG